MPEHLTWFKWESYATWLSGVALLILLYWVGAELYLIDWTVMELAPWQAIRSRPCRWCWAGSPMTSCANRSWARTRRC
jgi:uncharacterized membrane protein